MSKTRNSILWSVAIQRASKLILLDVFWGIVVTVIGLLLITLIIVFPINSFCSLLQSESESKKSFHLPFSTFILEIFWNSSFHAIPFLTFVLLTEQPENESGIKVLFLACKRWRKVIRVSALFATIDATYRFVFYFMFALRKDPKQYPLWFSFPLNINWIIGAISTFNVAARVWTAKYSAYLVIQKQIPQSLISVDTDNAFRMVRKKMILSIIFPAFSGIIIQQSVLNILHVSLESHRAMLIIFIIVGSYPMWWILEREGRKPLPWTSKIRELIPEDTDSVQQGELTDEPKDPLCLNGMVLSGFIVSGTIVTVRILQANMETLTSKVAAGILASSLESFVVIIKPHISKGARKTSQKIKDTLASIKQSRVSKLHPQGILNINTISTDQAPNEESKHRIYRWHRAHLIILMNRLEMYSIMFSNTLMMVAIHVKNRAIEAKVTSGSNSVEECVINSTTQDFIVSFCVLTGLEVVIEFCTYVYLLKMEGLCLEKVSKRSRFKLCFFYFSLLVIMYFVNMFLSMGYTILSCEGIDDHFFEYHCL